MKKIFLLIVIALFTAPLVFSADTYKVDPGHSRVGFVVTHLVISKVNGQFEKFTGTIVYDAKDVTKSSVKGTIDATSINTNNANRDRDLKSDLFFDVAKYPEITFESKSVEKKGDGLVVIGALTMHGVTKDVELNVHVSGPVTAMGGQRIAVEATTTINRQDWGINYNKIIDGVGVNVSNEVQLTINAEAQKQ
jgi:polyisoprenoid-binding protein YceI